MTVNGRLAIVALGAFALSGWFMVNQAWAAGDDIPAAVNKVADALEKGDKAGAAKEAKAAAAKIDDLEDLMHSFSLRRSKGLGVGAKAGDVTPDGIEAKIMNLTKKPESAAQLGKESAALVRMGYQSAAVGLIAHNKAPAKDEGKKKKADWLKWSDDMEKAAIDFAGAAKNKNPAAVKTAATKLYSTCTICHETFRE